MLSGSKAISHIITLPEALVFYDRNRFLPPEPQKHIIIPRLTVHLNCCLVDFVRLCCYLLMAHLEIKSWGCHGSAHIYIVLKCQDDEHCAVVPQDSNPARLWQFHTQATKHISSGNRYSSLSSLTLPSMQQSGLRLIKARSWLFWKIT